MTVKTDAIDRYAAIGLNICLGLFFVSCVLGNVTAIRNLSVALLIVYLLIFCPKFVFFDRRTVSLFFISIFFLLASFPGACVAENFQDYYRLVRDYIFYIILFCLGLSLSLKHKFFSQIINLQAFAALVLALLSIFVLLIQKLPVAVQEFIGHWYPWYGVASTFFVLMLPVLVLFLDPSYGKENKRSFFVLGISLLVICIAVENRALYLVVFFVSVYVLSKIYRSFAKIVGVVILLLSVVISILIYKTHQRQLPDGSDDLVKVSAVKFLGGMVLKDPRVSGWDFWIEKGINEMPWYGFGEGKLHMSRLLSTYEKADPRLWDSALTTHTHNLFLNVIIRSGYIGVSIFVVLWIYLFSMFRKDHQKNSRINIPAVSGSALLLAMLFKNMTDDFFEPPMGLLFFFWLGILAGYHSLGRRSLINPATK